MDLKILGTRGEINESLPRHSKHSGLLIDGVLLLDLGEKQYLKHRPRWILLTHFHPDHAYFIRRGHEERPHTQALIFAPEKKKKWVCVLNRKKTLGPYSITPIPTHHSKYVKSQAYLIEKDAQSILYTGDLIWIDRKYHHRFSHVDMVITDGSFIREGGMIRKDPETGKIFGHAGIPNLIRLFLPYAKKILFIHLGSWFYRNLKTSRKKLVALGKKYHVPILAGYDGQHLKLEG